MFECERCGRHWWAKRLEAGAVRPQIAELFGDAEDLDDESEFHVDEVMQRFQLPEFVETPMYWQVPTTGNQWHHYVSGHHKPFRVRTREFLRSALSLLHRAS